MSIIIRLENLHWSANAADIRYFFRGLEIPEGGVHIIGGENGDAFIAFESEKDAMLAMEKEGLRLMNNYVKLSYSTQEKLDYMVEQIRCEYVDPESQAAQDFSASDDKNDGNRDDYSHHHSRDHSFIDYHHSSVKKRRPSRHSSKQQDKRVRDRPSRQEADRPSRREADRPSRREADRHRDKSLDRVSENRDETDEMQFQDVRKDYRNLPERKNPGVDTGDSYNQHSKSMFHDTLSLSHEMDKNYDNHRDVVSPRQMNTLMQNAQMSYEDSFDLMEINNPPQCFEDTSHQKYPLREERNFNDDYLISKPHQQGFIDRDIRDDSRYSSEFQNLDTLNFPDSYEDNRPPRQIRNFPPNFCIRLSGLDCKATFKDVHALLRGFFAPRDNIKLEFDKNGHKTGTALVQMNNNEDFLAILALGEVQTNTQSTTTSKCSDEVFYKRFKHLRYNSPVDKSLGRKRMDLGETGDLCYMLKGIPFAATEEDIINFFNGLELLDMFILYDKNRKAIGTGFVQFFNVDDYKKAMERQGQKIGHRYIRLLDCTLEDLKSAKASAAFLSRPIQVVLNERMHRVRNFEFQQDLLQKRPLCVVVGGLPPSTTNLELFEFFEQCGTRPNAIHNVLHSKGSSSGRAFVEFNDLFELDVALKQQGQSFGQNVISVKQVLFNEMLNILELHPVDHEFNVIRKRYCNTNTKTEDTPEKMPYVWEPLDDANDEPQPNSYRDVAQNSMADSYRDVAQNSMADLHCNANDSNQYISVRSEFNRPTKKRKKMEVGRNLSELEQHSADRKPKCLEQFERNEDVSNRKTTDFRKQRINESNQFHVHEKKQRFNVAKELVAPVWLDTQQNFSEVDSNLLATQHSIVRDKRNDAPSAQRRNIKPSSPFKKDNFARQSKADVNFRMEHNSEVRQRADENNRGRRHPLPVRNTRANLGPNKQQSFRANDKARDTFDSREKDRGRKLASNQREEHSQKGKGEKRTSPSKSSWKTEQEHAHSRRSKSGNRDDREAKSSDRRSESRNQRRSYEKEPQEHSTSCTVQASNVPIYAEIHNIFRFFDGFHLRAENIIRRYTNEGLPTGDIRATFEYANDARNAVKLLNRCKMDGNEIFLQLV